MAVATGGVRLPDLHQRLAEWLALGVEHPAKDNDPLADRLTGVPVGQVVVALADYAPQPGPRDLGDRVRKVDQRLFRMPERG